MPDGNVDVVRRMVEAFNDGETGPVLDEVLDPEIEFVTSGAESGQATYHGLAGVRELQAQLQEAFDEIRIEADEIRAASDTVVVVLGRLRVRGRASGAVGSSTRAWVFTLRAGKVVRQETFAEQNEGMKAAGLGN